jgi:hypothetical protein
MESMTASRRNTLLIGFGILAGLVLTCLGPARDTRLYWQGRYAGWRSIRTGELLVHETGLPSPSYAIYRVLLKQRYGVTVLNHGCIPVVHVRNWQQGVNDAVSSYLRSRYAKDVFEECRTEAQHAWAQKYESHS